MSKIGTNSESDNLKFTVYSSVTLSTTSEIQYLEHRLQGKENHKVQNGYFEQVFGYFAYLGGEIILH